MRSPWRTTVAAIAATATLAGMGAVGATAQAADTTTTADKPTQTVNVDYATQTGDFRGGASGTLYGLGDDGSPTDAILDGARVENSSQKPPTGTQHPSGDALDLENQFFANGGKELAVYMQDYYPDWSYNGGKRPGDTRSYKLDVPVTDPTYGTYTEGANNTWDYAEVTEIVVNKILANTEHPDNYTFIPFNEPDGGNWYYSGDDANAAIFKTFLADWNSEYELVQKIWDEYRTGAKKNVHGAKFTNENARIAGPGDSAWKQNRSDAFLKSAKESGTLPDVFVWHELGKGSLQSYRSHYDAYRALEKKHGIDPLEINITEYGELRDMSVPGQLIQWQSMFEDTKVQAETAYWNYAGNLSDNMARANAANAGWWQFKWYGDLRGQKTVKVTGDYQNVIDSLQAIAAIDTTSNKATVLYGGANDTNADAVQNTGAGIPVTVHLTGLDKAGLSGKVDVEVRENAFTGPDGVAAAPRVVNAVSGAEVKDGTLDVTTVSADRYASYQLVVTPHQDRVLTTDANAGHAVQTIEAEKTSLAGGAQAYTKTPSGSGWSYFMASGNGDVGNFKTGGTATWNVTVPADGTYRLQVTSGNPGFPGTNAVTVDGKDAGTLNYGAELAMKDAAKWKYYGSAELELTLTKGAHAIALHGDSSFDNTLDKFLLYQTGNGKDSIDATEYPASQFRLEDGARLSWEGDGTNGFAALGASGEGSADVFAHAWNAGYQDVTVTYNAAKGAKLSLAVNGLKAADLTAGVDGLQTSTVRVALSEGINKLTLAGADDSDATKGALVKSVATARPTSEGDADAKPITVEAEAGTDQVTLGGGATVMENAKADASGKKYVTGLGNQFETAETGAAGFGDQTRVVVKDSNNTPTVHEDNKGTLTIKAGTVPAGTYNAVVSFSNDAFIGKHSYNPQIVDLGLQVRQGDANGSEIARGAFRYTYSDSSFLNRSLELTTDGSSLTLGNWDPAGTGKGSVSWGVAPNVDKITFYPIVSGEVTNAAAPSTLTGVKVSADRTQVNLGETPTLTVTAAYADGSEKELAADAYQVSGFDPNKAGEQTLTVTYAEGRVTRTATVVVTVKAKEEPVPQPSSDASLKSLSVAGVAVSIADAAAGKASVEVADPSKVAVADVKVVTADKASAKVAVKDAVVTVTVTAEDGTTVKVYKVALVKKTETKPETKPEECRPLAFSDVSAATPHKADIDWLACKGISTGWATGENTAVFSPMGPVVRQDMAAFLYRLAGSPEYTPSDGDKARFTDVTESTPHAREIWWLASTGIAEGFRQTDGSFQFGGMRVVVRQDMAAFLKRLADYRKADPALGEARGFSDVDAATPHAGEIGWLARTGVAAGFPDGSFGGMRLVVRQDMAAFLHRMDTNVLAK